MERQKNTDAQEMQKEILDIRKEFEEIREAENFLEEETEIKPIEKNRNSKSVSNEKASNKKKSSNKSVESEKKEEIVIDPKLKKLGDDSMKSVFKIAQDSMKLDETLSYEEALAKALLTVAKRKNKAIENRKNKDMEVSREKLRKLVQVVYDYQDLRIRTSNRLSKKADGTDQNKDDAILPEEEIPQIRNVLDTAKEMEDEIFATIKTEVEKFPIYTEFLSKVKGCGPALSAIIISTIDIHKADTPSKIIQYAGLNPGLRPGKKKDKDGNIILSDEMVRGDKRTKGYLIPYNANLKSKLMGVLASCMLKANSQYRIYYDSYKNRLMNSEKPVNGDESKKWKDEGKAHINMAACRYMIKIFLQDLYDVWRKLEGLSVRVPYQEEYLGHKTSMPRISDAIMRGEM